jgi:hypothetical protein
LRGLPHARVREAVLPMPRNELTLAFDEVPLMTSRRSFDEAPLMTSRRSLR